MSPIYLARLRVFFTARPSTFFSYHVSSIHQIIEICKAPWLCTLTFWVGSLIDLNW
jgi:hypothetical protein